MSEACYSFMKGIFKNQRFEGFSCMAHDALFWIDLEMTGLDSDRDTIIEIASVVTDNNLNFVAEGPALVIHQPESVLESMDEWNRSQHGGSGLIASIRTSTTSLSDAYEQTLVFARQYCKYRVTPVCGNSVFQDRAFLRRLMPELDKYFHYRIIDVTSVKELVRRWYPLDKCIYFEKKTDHRALADVYASIEELKHYRTHFFKKDPD